MIPNNRALVPFFSYNVSAEYALSNVSDSRAQKYEYAHAKRFLSHQKKVFHTKEEYVRRDFQSKEARHWSGTRERFLSDLNTLIVDKEGDEFLLKLLFPAIANAQYSRSDNRDSMFTERDSKILKRQQKAELIRYQENLKKLQFNFLELYKNDGWKPAFNLIENECVRTRLSILEWSYDRHFSDDYDSAWDIRKRAEDTFKDIFTQEVDYEAVYTVFYRIFLDL
ncbi:hypothetical protein PLEI_2963 [Photobacterium leiognathi lrivu.4.1]|uniref:Uncharacterized protein n=1 Tax=Photobacterium leiognathi lrivu.4.1 TaxID=1248232 RepID=V5F278_PHOLE|nr:hypothetical protein [Photobacterium leiognathi]GAD31305.1 hypothetical protein PLEI_2963 [Photobacterium leiognathi lrivu.4.1]